MVLQVLPTVIATFTIAGPPVTMFTRASGCASRLRVLSWEGLSYVVINPFGAPAAVAAPQRRVIVATQVLKEAGCGANTTALPAARIEIALLMIVAAGFVDGVIAATTPYGAYSTSVSPLSPV